MTRYHPPVRWMNNFKAVLVDHEFYLSLSDKPQSVCLTERQMYILSVQNTYTYWMTRWYNTDDTSAAEIRAIAAEIEDLLMCGCGIPAPTITDVMNGQTYVTETNTFYNTTYNTWNDAGQTVASIAPNMDYGTGDPASIDKILCLGLKMWLDSIMQQAVALKNGTAEENKDLMRQLGGIFAALGAGGSAAVTAGGAAASLVAFLGGPWLLLGLVLAGIGMLIASLVATTDMSVLTDAAAIDDVYCTLVNNLVGSSLSESAFQNALTPNEFAPGSHAAQIGAIVQNYLDDQTAYLQFLVAMNGLYDAAPIGVLPDCGCGDGNCENLAASQFGWYPSDAFGAESATFGVYASGLGPAAGNLFFWSREATTDLEVSSVTIRTNEAFTSLWFRRADLAFMTYSGAAVTEYTFDETTHPANFPMSLDVLTQLSMDSNTAPSSSFRVIEFCWEPTV